MQDHIEHTDQLFASNDDGEGKQDSAVAGGFRITDLSLVEGTDLSFVGPVAKGYLHNWSIAPEKPQPSLQHNLTMAPRMPGGMGGGAAMMQPSANLAPSGPSQDLYTGTQQAIQDDE